MLAYSSVAHAGFVITALVSTTVAGISAVLTYLFLYAIATLGVFAVISLVRHQDGREATDLADWAGLGRRNPWLGGAFTLLLLSMAGIPLTAGFVAKFGVFQAAAQAHFGVLVIVGVISSAVAAVFYLRVVAVLFFTETPPQTPVVVRPMVTSALVGSAAVATLLLGIFPQPLLHLAEHAGNLLH
ncbi:MAG: NADH-quinone oxidoreductase subunit N, partial [Mycobacterium sp.]|nr:NADH-quinone oxidoreductase subunit N [Mycobacterium sp.]